MESHNGEADDLPPPPPLAAGVEPLKADETKMPLKPRSLVQRNGFGRKGQQIKLITNHFKVSLMKAEDFFYHYYVNLKYEDDTPVDRKGSGRKVIEKLQQTYAAELANKDFAYDGGRACLQLVPFLKLKWNSLLWMKTFQLERLLQMAVQAMIVLLEVTGKGSEGLTIQRHIRLNYLLRQKSL